MTVSHHTNGTTPAVEIPWLERARRELDPETRRRFEGYLGEILGTLGMDLDTPGTADTPRRFLQAMFDATEGYAGDPKLVGPEPEAAPIGPNLSLLRDRTGGRARVYEGSGGILLIDSFRRGIAGTMPGMEFLDGIVPLWKALQRGDDETAYRLFFPICALVALQLQAGLDGFLAIEKYVLHKRGLFATDRRREPFAWSLDEETRRSHLK